MDQIKWLAGLLVSVFNLLARIETRVTETGASLDRLDVSASRIASTLDSCQQATLAMNRAAEEIRRLTDERRKQ